MLLLQQHHVATQWLVVGETHHRDTPTLTNRCGGSRGLVARPVVTLAATYPVPV